MRTNLPAWLRSLPLLAASVCLWPSHALAEPPRYTIEFLDVAAIEAPNAALPDGGTCSFFGGASCIPLISSNGRYLAGYVSDPDDPIFHRVPFRIDRSTGTVLFIPELSFPGTPEVVFAVNNNGAVAVQEGFFSRASTDVHYWSPETGVISYGPPATISNDLADQVVARRLNDAGQILVIENQVPGAPDTATPGTQILWDPIHDTRTPISDLGADFVRARSLNNLGQVVGSIFVDNFNDRAFVWDATNGMRLLPDLGGTLGGLQHVAANGINDSGVIVGEGYAAPTGRLVGQLWQDETTDPIELPCAQIGGLPVLDCAAWWINQSGQVFGGHESDEVVGAFHVWEGTQPYLLDELIVDPDAAFFTFSPPSDTNEVAGSGSTFDSQTGQAMNGPALLVPVEPPLAITVTSPTADASVPEGQVIVEGTATDDVEVTSVTVNGIEAVLTPTGNPDDPVEVAFSVSLELDAGTRSILAIAADGDGHTAQVEFEITVVPQQLACDANGDGVVDITDIQQIFAARGSSAEGPDDPRDVNGDGLITINDGRLCVLQCTNPRCAPEAGD